MWSDFGLAVLTCFLIVLGATLCQMFAEFLYHRNDEE